MRHGMKTRNDERLQIFIRDSEFFVLLPQPLEHSAANDSILQSVDAAGLTFQVRTAAEDKMKQAHT